MGRRSKIRLSLGAGTARKVKAAVFASPMFFVAGVLIWMPADLIVESLTENPINVWGSLVPHLFVTVGFMLGVYIVGAVGLAIVAVLPYASRRADADIETRTTQEARKARRNSMTQVGSTGQSVSVRG
ncbi:hypothetical protein ACQP2C_32105 [Micromonospora zamorensis]|uniref:hypothetical protein n=1 Tax=Micromonospora zamorensis TaxID=709883 RepID=UPI003D9770D9